VSFCHYPSKSSPPWPLNTQHHQEVIIAASIYHSLCVYIYIHTHINCTEQDRQVLLKSSLHSVTASKVTTCSATTFSLPHPILPPPLHPAIHLHHLRPARTTRTTSMTSSVPRLPRLLYSPQLSPAVTMSLQKSLDCDPLTAPLAIATVSLPRKAQPYNKALTRAMA